MSQTYDNKKAKAARYSARDLKNIRILSENSAEGLGPRRERCWRYVVSVFENTPKNLVVQGRAQLEHSSHIVKVGVEATSLRFNPWRIWKETTERGGSKTTRTRENFNNRGTKISLSSDELWLIANNYKSLVSGGKSIMIKNLGLCKRSEIYLI